MITVETVLVRGNQLHERVAALSHSLDSQLAPQSKLVLSFDLYCILLEYTALMGQLNMEHSQSVPELLLCDDLIFDTGVHKLMVSVDFFGPTNSVQIS
jgi:hypothetical protein